MICSSVRALLPALPGGCPGRFPASRAPGPSLLSPPALGGQALTQSSGQLATLCPCSPALTSFIWTRYLNPSCCSPPGVQGRSFLGCPLPALRAWLLPRDEIRPPSSVPCPGQSAPQWLGPFPRASRPLSCLPLVSASLLSLCVICLSLVLRDGDQTPLHPAQPSESHVLCTRMRMVISVVMIVNLSHQTQGVSRSLRDPPKPHYSETYLPENWPHAFADRSQSFAWMATATSLSPPLLALAFAKHLGSVAIWKFISVSLNLSWPSDFDQRTKQKVASHQTCAWLWELSHPTKDSTGNHAFRPLSPWVFILLLSSRWVVSDSLQLRGLQHARLPCPSLSPGAHSNSCPLSQ